MKGPAAVSPKTAPSAWRLALLAFGYLVALGGALSTFRLPLTFSHGMLVAGVILTIPPSCGGYWPPPPTWRTLVIFLLGSAVITEVLAGIGEDRVRHWTPHPAGYIVAWVILLSAFRHFRKILRPALGDLKTPVEAVL